MGSIKITIEDELLKKFREEAMRRFGYVKGSLSIAAREAISNWLKTGKKSREIEEFEKVLRKVSGIWTEETGYKYVRKIRKKWENRTKRLKI